PAAASRSSARARAAAGRRRRWRRTSVAGCGPCGGASRHPRLGHAGAGDCSRPAATVRFACSTRATPRVSRDIIRTRLADKQPSGCQKELPMGIDLSTLVFESDRYLAAGQIADYCPNGLQVQGRPRVRRIVSGVTASQALLDAAVADNADLVLVHHGYFWRNEDPRVVG